MVFNNNQLNYRVALNTQTQMFMAYDAANEQKVGYGNTIEKALVALKKLI